MWHDVKEREIKKNKIISQKINFPKEIPHNFVSGLDLIIIKMGLLPKGDNFIFYFFIWG